MAKQPTPPANGTGRPDLENQASQAVRAYLVAAPRSNAKTQRLYLPCSLAAAKMATMSRSTQQLEARLAKVEKELAELKAVLGTKRSDPWYRQIVGDFAGDKAFAEIIRLGRLIRRGKLKG